MREVSGTSSMQGRRTWCFRYRRTQQTVDLRADAGRGATSRDPLRRGLHLGCGAALLRLRAAAVQAGLRPWVELLPDAADPDTLASVTLVEAEPDAVDRELPTLPTDRTEGGGEGMGGGGEGAVGDRASRDGGPALSAALMRRLAEEVRGEGARLAFPAGRHLALVLDLLEEPERGVPHGGGAVAGPALALGSGPGIEFGLGLGLGTGHGIGSGSGSGAGSVSGSEPAAYERLPQLGLVCTRRDRPRDWLVTGQAMERALLRAGRAEPTGSPTAQPLERGDLRWLLRDPLHGDGPVQTVLRFDDRSTAPSPSSVPSVPSPSRRVREDVLEIVP